jgi:hypothetical protein
MMVHDFYLEWFKELSDAEVGRLMKAALEYSKTGKNVELKGNEKFLFSAVKNQIDRDKKCGGITYER